MFLMDYSDAVEYLSRVLESYTSVCFHSITCSVFGDRIIFTAEDGQTNYIVFRTGRVEVHYPDTWRNPEHKTILCEGNDRNIW